MTDLTQIQQQIGFQFKNSELLHQSLVHRSFLNENRHQNINSNERLEFLGDAILEFWISDTLFHQFPQYEEGDLTNLRALVVCTQNLALIANSINLGDCILLSKGEETHGGRQNQSILADTFEAIIGAIYLDQGIQATKKFLAKLFVPSINQISQQKIYKDPKSLFQEIAQAKQGITPHYETIREAGPDHNKTFEVGVYLDNTLITTGSGTSKQRAEESAAIAASKILSKKD